MSHIYISTCMNFQKAGQPRTWRRSNGATIKVETPNTNKAKELAAVYIKLLAESDLEDEERFPALQEVEEVVINELVSI